MSLKIENNLLSLSNDERMLYKQAKQYERLYERDISHDAMTALYCATALAEQFGDGSLLRDNVKNIERHVEND